MSVQDELWAHARCCDISVKDYKRMQLSDDKWSCPKCVALCGLSSENIFNSDPAVECDSCKSWVHTKCSLLPEDQYIFYYYYIRFLYSPIPLTCS